MRQKLRQTTINKNYLTNVLNSMNDAVLVTSPDGVIKRMANDAACKLLGYSEEELAGRGIISMLDERERRRLRSDAGARMDTRETVVDTRSGQTIPVSLIGLADRRPTIRSSRARSSWCATSPSASAPSAASAISRATTR